MTAVTFPAPLSLVEALRALAAHEDNEDTMKQHPAIKSITFTPASKGGPTVHYFAGRGRRIVIISPDLRPIGEEIEVSGKIEARQIAADRGAHCWNF